MAESETRFRVWRGDAGGGGFRQYALKARPGMVLLDALHAIQSEQANDLAVRWNCKAGRCGSCSAEVDGRPRLLCMTRVDAFAPGAEITIAPMQAFPLIRDLVTDVSINYEKAGGIPPFAPDPHGPGEGMRMYQEDVERIREFHKCIECFLCQDTCHVLRDHAGHRATYAGPRNFARLASLEMNPLDRADRVTYARETAGLGLCNVTKCCTEVCPEGIRITDNAIIPLKERVVDRHMDPVASVLRFFGGRS